LAEINSIQKQLADVEQKPEAQTGQFRAAVAEAQSNLSKILESKERAAEQGPGLLDANKDLTSALQVVESGDRPVPAQAVAVYQESSQHVKACIRELAAFKQAKLTALNQQLRRANLPPIAMGEVEQEVEFVRAVSISH
jgi:hypothetical protein